MVLVNRSGEMVEKEAMTELVLSLFPGIGLLDRAFAAAGFCIVQAADKITGGDVREFHGVPGLINGIVAGPPCQGFSVANSHRKKADRAGPRESDCLCGCGRSVSGKQLTATASCRKRKQLSSIPKPWVDVDGYHEP